MNYSDEANEYWDTKGIRFLGSDSHIPSVEERVKAAFDEGYKSVHRKNWLNAFKNLKCIASSKAQINFPNER
jgi:predicted secreted protein